MPSFDSFGEPDNSRPEKIWPFYFNGIEIVFSGMARAVLHNSDYESEEAAMKAI